MFEAFVNELKRNYVFDIKFKDESTFMYLLSKILFFNKGFMTKFITTIGSTIYFPSREYIKMNEFGAVNVLAHEVVHVAQAEKYGKVPFSLMYLFPQCLALLSLLAFLAIWYLPFLWCLLFLVFLAPIPAPWRKKFELEGYTMSLFMSYLQLKKAGWDDEKIKAELALYALRYDKSMFRGSGYWFMWPFGVMNKFEKKIEDICNGVISGTDETYGRMKRLYVNAVTAYEL